MDNMQLRKVTLLFFLLFLATISAALPCNFSPNISNYLNCDFASGTTIYGNISYMNFNNIRLESGSLQDITASNELTDFTGALFINLFQFNGNQGDLQGNYRGVAVVGGEIDTGFLNANVTGLAYYATESHPLRIGQSGTRPTIIRGYIDDSNGDSGVGVNIGHHGNAANRLITINGLEMHVTGRNQQGRFTGVYNVGMVEAVITSPIRYYRNTEYMFLNLNNLNQNYVPNETNISAWFDIHTQLVRFFTLTHAVIAVPVGAVVEQINLNDRAGVVFYDPVTDVVRGFIFAPPGESLRIMRAEIIESDLVVTRPIYDEDTNSLDDDSEATFGSVADLQLIQVNNEGTSNAESSSNLHPVLHLIPGPDSDVSFTEGHFLSNTTVSSLPTSNPVGKMGMVNPPSKAENRKTVLYITKSTIGKNVTIKNKGGYIKLSGNLCEGNMTLVDINGEREYVSESGTCMQVK